MDNEIKGTGNSINFTYRVHDPRLGRFLSRDPLSDDFAWNSPYAFSENRVIDGVEFEGLETISPWLGALFRTTTRIGVETSKATGEMCKPISVPRVTPRPISQYQDHHLIPQQFRNIPEVQNSIKRGFKFDKADNIERLESYSKTTGEGQHANHPKYNGEFLRRLREFRDKNPNSTKEQQFDFIKNTAEAFREIIKNSPGTKVNDFYKAPEIKMDNTLVAPTRLPIKTKEEQKKENDSYQKYEENQKSEERAKECPTCS